MNTMNKRRLLKDLPFGNLKAGKVLTKANGYYYIERGETFYGSGGKSHNGWEAFQEECEIAILDMIWDDPEWFTDSKLTHVIIKTHLNLISLEFEPLDMGQAQTFARGVMSCLQNYGNEDKPYVWHELKGFTTEIK